MQIRGWVILAIVGALALLAAPVVAQPYGGPGWTHAQRGTGQPLSIDQAEQIARQFLDRAGYAGLALDEIQEFSNNFYVAVKYKTGGRGAFEFLIDRYSGFVHPEPPTMMWNTQFGHMTGQGGPWSTGHGPGGYAPGGGMMGGRWMQGTGPGSAPAVTPTVTAAQAETIAQTFLNSQFPGTKVRNVDAFPGYYTIDVTRDGKVAAMLSVDAYTGRVWYHSWHGTFIQEKELR